MACTELCLGIHTAQTQRQIIPSMSFGLYPFYIGLGLDLGLRHCEVFAIVTIGKLHKIIH